jgi:hypothetical protein
MTPAMLAATVERSTPPFTWIIPMIFAMFSALGFALLEVIH